jgi:DNA invertase Pin-like site-specific DNA recombinase
MGEHTFSRIYAFRNQYICKDKTSAIAVVLILPLMIFRNRYRNHPRILLYSFLAMLIPLFGMIATTDWIFGIIGLSFPILALGVTPTAGDNREKRGVIYVRVSKDEQQKEGYSIPSQLRILKELMDKDGVEEVHPPIIEAESGRGFDRKGIEELIRLAESREIDVVYIYRLDRLGRVVAETPFFMYKLNELGVAIRSPQRWYKLENPMDFLWTVFESAQADMESRNIGERTQRGKVEKFLHGKWVGHGKFGYSKVGEVLIKNPEMGPAVRGIFETYRGLGDVKTTTSSYNTLFAERFGNLSVSQVRRVLSDSIYIGKPRYGKASFDAPQLAMVPLDLFEAVQKMLNDKASKRMPKQPEKAKSIWDKWAKKLGADYVANVLNDVLTPICPKCRKINTDKGYDVITGPIMRDYSSKIVDGVRLPRFICPEPTCRHQRTVPLGSQLKCFEGASLLICPNCKCWAVENFDVRPMVDGLYEYTCMDCGFWFRTSLPPDKALRKLPEPSTKNPEIKKRAPRAAKKPIRPRKTKPVRSTEAGKFKTLDRF